MAERRQIRAVSVHGHKPKSFNCLTAPMRAEEAALPILASLLNQQRNQRISKVPRWRGRQGRTGRYKAACDSVIRQFFYRDGDVYRQKRIEEELAKSLAKSDIRRNAANFSWGKVDANASANASANAHPKALQKHMQTGCGCKSLEESSSTECARV